MDIEKAFKRLLIKSPFYGLFCLSLPKTVTTTTDTLCVRKKGINLELCINPDFWEEHTDDEQLALLQHELGHIAFQHMFMVNSFTNAQIFNIAADMEVNSYIENLPSDGCKASDIGLPDGEGTKRYYEELTKLQSQQQQSSQSNQGQSQNDSQDNSQGNSQDNKDGNNQEENQQSNNPLKGKKSLDDHNPWKEFEDIPEATKQLMVNNVNSLLKSTAEQISKQHGTIPGELSEIISKLNEKKPEIFNWKHYFRRLLGSIYDVNIKTTRRKESKRFEGAAGIQHKKKVSILVAVDTSGSVATEELRDFFGEIEYIYKAGARVTILECDTRINKIVEYDGKRIPEIHGRGGTDFNPPVEYYIKHKKEYASLIYFTDGECSLPNRNPSGMVWVITSNGMHQDFPGKVIYIPDNH
jgi:predicted metal-dependent peptidase